MLLPSIDEPFGLSTIESMSCGTVAIGANSGATTEIIRNNVDGFIIQPDNHIELADLLVKLMSNDETRKNVGMNSRRTIVERFSIDKLVESLDKMYKGLLNE
jgi:polysaccharide biosynthesis protein PelF